MNEDETSAENIVDSSSPKDFNYLHPVRVPHPHVETN
ncbi:hypothetical protein E2C01_063461 [Portunus trituberculatus]|uniref:Uncharacterized protein n=1 Tax=Portunus trituberculatus TaxID=210409 RepID=A0A5B7HKX3_PORTR|nr:hypothetical protein [Portunus trituberculatus]